MITRLRNWIDGIFEKAELKAVWYMVLGAAWTCTFWAWFGGLIPYENMWFERITDPIILAVMIYETVRKIRNK